MPHKVSVTFMDALYNCSILLLLSLSLIPHNIRIASIHLLQSDLSPAFFLNSVSSFAFFLEYAIRKVQETNLGMDMNGTHEDDVNLIGDDIRKIERNADV